MPIQQTAFLKYFHVPCGETRIPLPGKAEQPQEQCYPFLISLRSIFVCANNGMATTVQVWDF